ncbi:MAG: discoidin domain-containing protein [Clostridia bacterium]|nr:discoidin domain-containing protein [Clostridia bacterium]
MKRTTRLFALLLAAMLTLAMIPFSASAVSTALQGKTIVALGDSMTRFGTTSSGATSSTGEKTYPYYLSTNDYLGVPVINAGVGGDTTNHVMARFKADVLDKNPDVVIICIGMNDQATVISSGQPNVSLAVYRSNLEYFVQELRAKGSDVVFVTPSPVNSNSGYYVPGAYGLDYSGVHMASFCNAIREIAIANDCSLVDINYECAFEDMNTFAQVGDGIHHSDYGRKQYAKYISDHLQAVYDGTNKATMTVKCVDEKGNLLTTKAIVGAAGAHITVASPAIAGYSTSDSDVQTTFVDGAEFTFTYALDIYSVIEKAETLIASDYSPEIIELIREELATAKALSSASSPDANELIACSNTLNALINTASGVPYVVSNGADYTTTAPNRGDAFDDDEIRLTDGEKDTADGGTNRYSGWSGATAVDINIDLGEAKAMNSFSAYAASDGGWGIKKPAKLTVSISNDGSTYTEIASQTHLKTTFNLTSQKGTWDTTVITAVSEEIHTARYVRLTVTPNGSFVWLSEVEAALRTRPVENSVYVTGINKSVVAGDTIVFTPAFGTVTGANANHKWTRNLLAEWNADKNAYTVIDASNGSGDSTPDVTLTDGQIFIACHSDEVNDSCIINRSKFSTLEAGDSFTLSGIDVNTAKADVLSYLLISDYEGEAELENGSTLWVTHFNNTAAEGAGSIFTQEYTGCAWWVHAAFKPVEGLENVYELVEKSDGASNGTATPLAIPEGGFVYAVNTGNDWISINNDEHDVNYKNKGSSDSLSLIRSLRIGDKLQFSGLNLDTMVIPTTTEYIDYYSEGYVCTAKYAKYVDANDPNANQVPVKVSHVNLYNWQTFESMIISGDGKTVVDVINQRISTDWVVYTVEKQDGKYIATNCYENSNECHTVTVPAGGFLYCVYKANSAYDLAKDGGLLGAEFDLAGLSIGASDKLAIDTNTSSASYIYLTVPEKPEPNVTLGDVNDDGAINQYDYILVKRHYFGTRYLTDDETTRGDVNEDGTVNQFDYILICRHYFGTYVIG